MSLSNFQDVSELNNSWGNPQGDQSNPDWSRAGRQLDLIMEEVQEMVDGINDRNMDEVKDGAGDSLVTIYGLMHIMGIDADKVMAEISRSNRSKICLNIDEVGETIVYYKDELNIDAKYRDSPLGGYAVYVSRTQTGNDGKVYPEGKILKNIHWSEPDLSNC